MLAEAEPLPSLYRAISEYPHLAKTMLPGNPEHLTEEALRNRAWQLLAPDFQVASRHAAERFAE